MSSNATSGGSLSRRSSGSSARTVLRRLESPLTTYYLLLGIVGLLVTIGLVMVLSASMIASLKENDSSFTIFLKQLMFATIGLGALAFSATRSIRFWKRVSLLALAGGVALLALVPLIGQGFQGNKNWIYVGPVSIQPSEIAKIGLILGGALVLERKRALLGSLGHALVPFVVPITVGVLGLVLVGRDLGTALVIAAIAVGMLFAAGVRLRWFAIGLGAMSAVVAVLAATSSNRMERIRIWLYPEQCAPGTDLYYAICRQPMHGRYALADGGWWGVGLGASREKWGWLSEPYNDFIFAIIGEELGLLGTLTIVALFAGFAVVGLRLFDQTDDFFVRLVTVGVCAWILVQAMVNIGSVIGMLPVIGVPLPFVSAGGSSLVMTMIGVGILISFARSEPACAAALSTRPTLRSRARALVPIPFARRRTRS